MDDKSKDVAIVKIAKDYVEIRNEDGGMMYHYWVTNAGIKKGYEYPCVMVEVLHDIKRLQELGYDIVIQ